MLFLEQFLRAFLGLSRNDSCGQMASSEAALFCVLLFHSRIRVCAPWLLKPFEGDRRELSVM